MHRLKIYVSGPIADRPDANREEFVRAASLVRTAGAEPLLPHDIHPAHSGPCSPNSIVGSDGHSWSCHLRQDILQMLQCDGVVMLTGWEASHGARLEHTVAAACGLPVHYLSEYGSIRTSMGVHLFEKAREVAGA